MATERKVEEYRKYTLISAFFKGEYIGRVSKGKDLILEIKGHGIDEVMERLKQHVDEIFAKLIAPDAADPETQQYIDAFKRIVNNLSDGHCAMLKAHYHAPEQTITATELAAAALYRNYGAANLQYGLVGKMLYEELPTHLPTRGDGTPIFTYALATAGESSGPEDHWRWKLRPQVACAIEVLGLQN